MNVLFDGKQFAEKKVAALLALPEEKRKKTLAVLLDPQNESGAVYVRMKQKMAERLGVNFLVFDNLEAFFSTTADGQMIQLPYPDSEELIKRIDSQKDVDGMREESVFLPATVRAVRDILTEAYISDDAHILVVGVWGSVGSGIANELGKTYMVTGMDKEDFSTAELQAADVVISATGQAGLVTADMVKPGVVIIDVGFPKGDVVPEVATKAAFFTPVPGGVGPVTVACLFENLLIS